MKLRELVDSLHSSIEQNSYRTLVSFSYYEEDKRNNFYDKLIHFGTGFLLERLNAQKKPFYFIITAKHVIDDAVLFNSDQYKQVVCSFPIQKHIEHTDGVEYKVLPLDNMLSKINSFEDCDISFIDISEVFNEIFLSKIDRLSPQVLKFKDNNMWELGFIFGLPAAINKYKNKCDMEDYRFQWRMLITAEIENPSPDLIKDTKIVKPIFLKFNRKECANIETISYENDEGIPDGNFIKTEGMSGSPFYAGDSVRGVLVEVYPDRKISPFPQALIVSDLKEIINQIDDYILKNT